jgi:hypothetical protein
MNIFVKSILKGLEQVGASMVPGGLAIDQAIHANIDAKGNLEHSTAILMAVNAGMDELSLFKPEMIADKNLFHEGVLEAHDAYLKISRSLIKA